MSDVSAQAANDRPPPLKIGVVGLNFGKWVLRDEIPSPECVPYFKLAAVCDRKADLAEAAANECGARIVGFEELLADPEIPVIGLFTPPGGRADLIRQAIRAGKDVMTTKPFERNPQAAYDILAEARDLGRVVHLNSPTPRPPKAIATISQWREEFALGAPVGGTMSTWVSYREQAEGSWLDDPLQCPAAPLFRIGIYMINDAVAIFGPAEEVHVMSSRLFTGRLTPDNAHMIVRFRNGSLVHFSASFCVDDADFYRKKSMFHFENGTVYSNAGPVVPETGARLAIVGNRNGRPTQLAECDVPDFSGYDWRGLYEAITEKRGIPHDYPEQVASGIAILLAMAESEQSGGPAKVRHPGRSDHG